MSDDDDDRRRWNEYVEPYEDFLGRLTKEEANDLVDGRASIASPVAGLKFLIDAAELILKSGTAEKPEAGVGEWREYLETMTPQECQLQISQIERAGRCAQIISNDLQARVARSELRESGDEMHQLLDKLVVDLLEAIKQDMKEEDDREPWQRGGD